METIELLTGRLDRLEKENRKLKRIVMVLCVAGGALLVMGQTRSVPKVVEAEKFVLKDPTGKEAAYLGMSNTGPELKVHDVSAPGAGFMSIQANAMRINSIEGEKKTTMLMGPAGIYFRTEEGKEVQKVGFHASGPTIELSDKQGFQTTIGSTDLVTTKSGEARKTSAASIVIFNKAGAVIWRAPID